MSSSRAHRGVDYQGKGDSKRNAEAQEDRLIALIEAKGTIERYEQHLKKMQKGTLDVTGFMKAASIDASIQMADLMFYGDTDKVRLEAAKEILDRAGYGKTQKVSVSGNVHVDHDTSKLELINMIVSSARRAGLPVREAQVAPKVIDVTPPPAADALPKGLDETPPEETDE